jgi:hypothetical protein
MNFPARAVRKNLKDGKDLNSFVGPSYGLQKLEKEPVVDFVSILILWSARDDTRAVQCYNSRVVGKWGTVCGFSNKLFVRHIKCNASSQTSPFNQLCQSVSAKAIYYGGVAKKLHSCRFAPRVMHKIQIWVDASCVQGFAPTAKMSFGGAHQCR